MEFVKNESTRFLAESLRKEIPASYGGEIITKSHK